MKKKGGGTAVGSPLSALLVEGESEKGGGERD